MSTILVTGGAGFIGSHTCVELLNSGYDVVVLDNLSNSSEESLRRVQKITGKSLKFYEGDIADKELVGKILDENKIFAVIHFAGLKAVGESCEIPVAYYRNNLDSTLALLEVMKKYSVANFVSAHLLLYTVFPREFRSWKQCRLAALTHTVGQNL